MMNCNARNWQVYNQVIGYPAAGLSQFSFPKPASLFFIATG